MNSKESKVAIRGSRRTLPHGSKRIGDVDSSKLIQITIILRRSNSSKVPSIAKEFENKLPHERKHLSIEEFEKGHGASTEDIEKIKKFAQDHQLEVVEANIAKRIVKLSGTIEAFSKAFDVNLALFEHNFGKYRGREGEIYVPKEISDIVLSVHGLDDRKQVFPRYTRFRDNSDNPQMRQGIQHPLDPPQIASLYNFPNNLDGSGQCIGILEFGGGFDDNNLNEYFRNLGINPPNVKSISVNGVDNTPNVDPGSDGEVQLDIEVAGAIAHGANIAVYFAENSDDGFINAIINSIHDSANNPSVISISWGGPEDLAWSEQTRNSMNEAFQDAASLGITICVASGDHGSSDFWKRDSPQCDNIPTMDCARPPDGKEHVDFPGSSPYVLACGGTTLIESNGSIEDEKVWNNGNGWATGGGISTCFDLPDYQSNAKIPVSGITKKAGRGVPDIAGNADGNTGYNVNINGQNTVYGGTSAVAPLWSALVAILNQGLDTRIGFLNPLLYTKTDALRDITAGNNDTVGNNNYNAIAGWDPCTGLGCPNGQKILSALKAR